MFKQYFVAEKEIITEPKKTVVKQTTQKPEDLLRDSGFKIKNLVLTSFGKQIDFAKKYSDEEIKKVLTGFNIKIKDKSIFIIE